MMLLTDLSSPPQYITIVRAIMTYADGHVGDAHVTAAMCLDTMQALSEARIFIGEVPRLVVKLKLIASDGSVWRWLRERPAQLESEAV